MSKTVLLATDKPFSSTARDQIVEIVEDAGYTAKLLESYTSKAQLLEAIADAHAVIVRSDVIDAEVMDAAKELKLIVRAGAGYDTIDLQAARERDMLVMNTPGQNANAVGELVFGMLLYTVRGRFSGKPGSELRGKTIGIHALGHTGRAVLRIAKGFEMTVFAFDPFLDAAAIEALGATAVSSTQELYSKSQFISLHIPATSETRQSINRDLLVQLPKGGTLVNTARKEVIDEKSLLAALEERDDLRYLTDIAPSAEIHAALTEKFGSSGRYFATPKKMGAQTEEANANAGTAAARQIVTFFKTGEAQNVVN